MTDTDISHPSVDFSNDPTTPPEGEHPFSQDLNPDFLEGENYGEQGPHPEKTARTAYDVKGVHRSLSGFEDDDLKRIPIMPLGSRLEQGATYIDLHESERHEFTARGDMVVEDGHWYAPKSSVPYWIWNRLLGIENPERLDRAD